MRDDVHLLMDQHNPDVLILDLNMPQRMDKENPGRFQALPTISHLMNDYPATSIVILTVDYQPSIIYGAMDRGVRGYILKSDDIAVDLPAAIVRVHQGGVYFSETIEGEIIKRASNQANGVSLPDRPLQALTLLTDMPNATHEQRAQAMNISISTYKKHLDEAYKALGVNNSKATIFKAIEYGIIPPPEYMPRIK